MSEQLWCALHRCSILRRRCSLRGANSMLHLAAFSPFVFMVTTQDKRSTDWREEERSLRCWFAPLSALGCCFPGVRARPWCSHRCSSQCTRAAPAQVWIWEQEVGHTPAASLLVLFLPAAVPPVHWEHITNTRLCINNSQSLLFCVLVCHGNPLLPDCWWAGIQARTHKAERKHYSWKNASIERSDKVWCSTCRDVLDFLYVKSKAKYTIPAILHFLQ